MKIAIMEPLGISAAELAERKKEFEAAGHRFVDFARTTDVNVLKEEVKGIDAMILANMPMPAEVIEAAPSLKYIDIAFTGVDHVGLAAAMARGVKASNASGYSNEAVAELALGMALSLARNIRAVEDRCRAGETKDGLVGFELKGKTVGIVGLGKIGTRSAELFHAMGCGILAHSRSVHDDAPSYVVQCDLDTLLKDSDIVVLHCPLNDSTKGLINKEKLALMKNTAMLINVARGSVVVSEDLANALQGGVIACAGIDVFDAEPPLDINDPLLNAPNTLVTPHVAFATKESMSLRAEIVFGNLRGFLNGEVPNEV
ncbi:MAG: hydroxyacid dehydrogenase [Lachnospiraceae bacterium]|nr:hydroxyacid dehydrogenase [Lachnospiraceae bacterium]